MVGTGPKDDLSRYELVERFVSRSGQGSVHQAILRSELRTAQFELLRPGIVVSLKQVATGGLGEARLEELHEAVARRRHPALGHQLEVFRGPFISDDAETADLADQNVLNVVAVWVEGRTLAVRAGEASMEEVLDWIRQIAEALDFLHADLFGDGSLLHRDIKPSNVVVTPDGKAVLIDPGLARIGPGTATGTPYGTPGFIPPECDADRTASSPAADRWQLAATLVAALLGKPPRRVGDCNALRKALADHCPHEAAQPEVFADAVLAMLAPDPADRPDSAARWAASLVAAAAPRVRRHRSRTRVVAVAAAGLLALIAAAVGFLIALPGGPDRSGPTQRALIDTRRTSGTAVDDQRRAYLSTEPIRWCRPLGCEVPDSAVSTGMEVILTCRMTGDRITNGNPISPVDDNNLILFASEVWYGVQLDDGTRGLLSEVWIHPDDRFARGLRFC